MTDTKLKTTSRPNNQIFDVAPPGHLPPVDATTRPVIVSNRAVMQDPMMKSETESQPEKPSTKIVIKPINAPASTPADNDVDGMVDAGGAVAPEPSPNDPESPAESAAVPAETDKRAAELEAEAKAQDELDELVEQKTYFLPINAATHRRSRRVFIFGSVLILFLALAWLDVAMDAGFVTLPGIRPLTHIFRG